MLRFRSGMPCFFGKNKAKLILLDINLVEESGFSLCKKIRETSNIPILFISARDSDSDVLIALNIGGDDYIKKPYSLSVLLAKVQVVLKRMEAMRQQGTGSASGECAAKGSMPDGCAESGAESRVEKDAVSGNTNGGGVLRLVEEKVLRGLENRRTGRERNPAQGKRICVAEMFI